MVLFQTANSGFAAVITEGKDTTTDSFIHNHPWSVAN
jgi:hypothetical protein